MCFAYGTVHHPSQRLKPFTVTYSKTLRIKQVVATTILLALLGFSCYFFTLYASGSEVDDDDSRESKPGFRGVLRARAENNEDDAIIKLIPRRIRETDPQRSNQQEPAKDNSRENAGDPETEVIPMKRYSGKVYGMFDGFVQEQNASEEEYIAPRPFHGLILGTSDGLIQKSSRERGRLADTIEEEASEDKVTVYNLTQPLEKGTVGACKAIVLEEFAHMMCVDENDSNQHVQIGSWQEIQLNELKAIFRQDPHDTMTFVDLGAGPGVYTVAAAALTATDSEVNNRRVVAVEPYVDNIVNFHINMHTNGLEDRVTLVTNILGGPKQAGGYHFRRNHIQGYRREKIFVPRRIGKMVQTITLNDILPLVKSDLVAIRMELDGAESKVLTEEGAGRFFETLDVRSVMMQWLPGIYVQECRDIYAFMKRHNMEATKPAEGSDYQVPVQDPFNPGNIPFIVWDKKQAFHKRPSQRVRADNP